MSCLPLTSVLSAALMSRILPKLRGIPTIWPFDDRVLLRLLPHLKADVARFHEYSGPCMGEIFSPHALQSIDVALLRLAVGRLHIGRIGQAKAYTLDDLIDILAGAK